MRKQICLNGEWDFMPDFDNLPVDELASTTRWEPTKILVPSSWRWSIKPEQPYQPFDTFDYPHHWDDAQSGVLRKLVFVSHAPGERVFLIFHAVLQEVVVYINHQRVYAGDESFLPIELDITPYVKNTAENDIRVVCKSWRRIETPTGSKLLVPEGSWFARYARGIWQDVILEYRPENFIQDAFIQTSLRNNTISVNVTVSGTKQYSQESVLLTIFDGDIPIKNFSPQTCSPGDSTYTTLNFQQEWKGALLWSPEHPHLYNLRVQLFKESNLVDTRDFRFGFREVWLEGNHFILNGVRINLRGDAWHYQGFVYQTRDYAANWYRLCKQTGINFIRLHAMPYPEFYLDLADEMGMLIVGESAIYGSSKQMQADHPDFLEACQRHLRAMLLRDRNHPSIIIWSMQNEMRWVDGRDGYKDAMRQLTRGMKGIDSTRPISYDGDNRLVEPEDMEIVSMHYNIDGTVASWDKSKPLIFGEHGKWHYISPQCSTDFAGHSAYLSFDRCMESIGRNERYFIEYARKENVTGITPFNIAYYCAYTMPNEDIRIDYKDYSEPGPKPKWVKAHSLTIQNGYVPGDPLFIPNPSYASIQSSFKPVTVIPDQYQTSFYGGQVLKRSFSVYNDTENTVSAKLILSLSNGSGVISFTTEINFNHHAGERQQINVDIPLPKVFDMAQHYLTIELFHEGLAVHKDKLIWKVFPTSIKTNPLTLQRNRAAFLRKPGEPYLLSRFLPDLTVWEEIPPHIQDIDMIVIGAGCYPSSKAAQQQLSRFVEMGGYLVVLEQDLETPGELVLSGKKFFSAFRTLPHHPIFKDLSDDDFMMWGDENIHASDQGYLVQNAFNKPEKGDLKILLECGMGDFGNGGLFWTPLVEYKFGVGKVVLNQVALCENIEQVPQAAILLRNMLGYVDYPSPTPNSRIGALVSGEAKQFFNQIGIQIQSATLKQFNQFDILIIELDQINSSAIRSLREFLENGGRVLCLPVIPGQEKQLTSLANMDISINPAPVYQVAPLPHPYMEGLSPHDLYLFEKVSYTQPPHTNRLICHHAIASPGATPLIQNINTPWERMFTQNENDEYQKMAVATMVRQADFTPQDYGLVFTVERGEIILWQVDFRIHSEKVRRVYTRLLANLGVVVDTPLFSFKKAAAEFGIEALMGIAYQTYQDYSEVEAYFSSPTYLLNNLGEGVYGWMQRQVKRDGWITVPNSSGKRFFLTVFIESDVNRDPLQRGTDVLPDSSIVPDLNIDINCPFRIFLNGKRMIDQPSQPSGPMKILDATLREGINRFLLVGFAKNEDIRFNVWFTTKMGDFLPDLRYRLTLD